jgi:hypothetical protein
LHGNELGEFRNTDKADAKLYPILYAACLIPILLFFKVFELLKTLNIKEKILTALIFLVIPLFPMDLLSGICKWVDYYTTNKHWRLVEATIVHKKEFHGARAPTDYLYTVKTKDTTIELSTTLKFPVEKIFYLKLCKTNLGMIIVDRYYDSIPKENAAAQARK